MNEVATYQILHICFFLKATLVEFPLSYPTYPNIYFSGGEEEKPKGPLVVYSFVVPLNTEDKVNYKEQQAVLRKALRAHLPKGLLLETREKGGEEINCGCASLYLYRWH